MIAIRRVTLESFRNYQNLQLETPPSPILLVGENGAGKTNLLEAISLLSPGRGLRRAQISELQNQKSSNPQQPWVASFQCEGLQGPAQIGLGRDPTDPDKRLLRIDGKTPRTQTALAGHINLLWLTPDQDRLLAENPTERRRFMDRLVYALHPNHPTHINRYEDALRNRNRLLQDGPYDKSWLDALEDVMAKEAVVIASARLHWLSALLPFLQEDVSPFPNLSIALEGLAEQKLENQAALDAEDALRAAFAQNREDDKQAGATRLGPHRTVLHVHHLDKDCPADLCSTGEQKILLVRLILAQARLLTHLNGAAPLMLFDDIMAHLDETRRTALCGFILDLKAQAWLTGTDSSFFTGFAGAAKSFHITQGLATALDD